MARLHETAQQDVTGDRKNRICLLMEKALTPTQIDIVDQSERHKHHREQVRGPKGKGETHYQMRLVSSAFEGMSKVARYRKVHKLLAPEFNTGLHALSLKLLTPQEANRNA